MHVRHSSRSHASLLLLALATSCAHGAPNQGRAGLGGREVSLRYEGTCAQLACCSTYSVRVPDATPGAYACGGVQDSCDVNRGWFAPGFTCDPGVPGRYRQPEDAPFLACNDNERWLSLPSLSHADCGQRYLVCYQGVRVSAVARDRSASNDSGRFHYEGSLGLLRAIGADPEARETFVSIYTMDQTDAIAADPHCVGDGP